MILYHAGEVNSTPKLDGDPREDKGRLGFLARGGELPFVLLTQADIEGQLPLYTKLVRLWRENGMRRLFLDSGAFTAWTQGRVVRFEDLYASIDALKPEVYVQLDVIGDAAGTRENLERMRADGYDPVPVFTRGAPWSDLIRLLDEADYICLGNIAKAGRQERLEWCRSVFAHVRDWMRETGKPLPRFHAFGVTQQDVLEAYPFYSADSSTAILKAGAFGGCFEFRNGKLKGEQLDTEKSMFRAPHLVDKANDGASMRFERYATNVAAMNAMARHVTKVWTHRGVIWPDHGEHLC